MAKKLQAQTNGFDEGWNTCKKQLTKHNTRCPSYKNSLFTPLLTKFDTYKAPVACLLACGTL